MKKKQFYEKPSMKVFELKHQAHLLQASGVQSMRSGYGDAQEYEWDEE